MLSSDNNNNNNNNNNTQVFLIHKTVLHDLRDYDHHRNALQSNQQNMHDTAYCIIDNYSKQRYKKTRKKQQNNRKS